jgi:hypothetical protein
VVLSGNVFGYRKSLIPVHSKRVLFWQWNAAGSNKIFLGLLATIFAQFWNL